MLGSSTLNYQSSDIYSSEIFQEHFLALFQAIGSNFYLVAEKPSNFAITGWKTEYFLNVSVKPTIEKRTTIKNE